MVAVLECADAGNHCGIIRCVAELWNVYSPAITLGMVSESFTQNRVRTDSASHCNMLYASFLHCHAELLHQYVDDGVLQRSGKVVLVMLHEIRIFLHPFLQTVEERSL